MKEPPKEAKARILELARGEVPKEACGFILTSGKKTVVAHCPNVHGQPEDFWKIDPAELERAEKKGKIKVLWHSHTKRSPEPSMADKVCAEAWDLPMLIVNPVTEQFHFYKPDGYEAPFVGRPFVYGVLDCYTLFRDVLEREKKITLPPMEYEDDWWKPVRERDGARSRSFPMLDWHKCKVVAPPLNLYLDRLKKGGFVKLSKDVELQPYDGILMTLQSEVPNHIGVYMGEGEMLHHVQGKVSTRWMYNPSRSGFYEGRTVCIIRHATLL